MFSNTGSLGAIPSILNDVGDKPVPVIFISSFAFFLNNISSSGLPPTVSENVPDGPFSICSNTSSNRFLFNNDALNDPVMSNTCLYESTAWFEFRTYNNDVVWLI